MDLAFLVTERDISAGAGVFTRNAFCGAPVRICRSLISRPGLRGLVVNNRVANVGSPNAYEDALTVSRAVADRYGLDPSSVLPASTGVIGWPLPIVEMTDAVRLAPELRSGDFADFARAIMTTDRYPKAVSRELPGGGRITACAKGAGMIEPDRATMRAFITTDCAISSDQADDALRKAVGLSFNRISVDSDRSTSDMALLLSSARVQVDVEVFTDALCDLCRELADLIVRNGEGVGHVIRAQVHRLVAMDETLPERIARAIVNSPLVKTAVSGNDPNVGRIVAVIGRVLADHGESGLLGDAEVSVCDTVIFRGGSIVPLDAGAERALIEKMSLAGSDPHAEYPEHTSSVDIRVSWTTKGTDQVIEVLGGDLTEAYVQENATYRS